jgi:hypothetical protein
MQSFLVRIHPCAPQAGVGSLGGSNVKTEQNTPEIEQRIVWAVSEALGIARFSVDFEHGQWWVTDLDFGAQWSVVDEEPGTDGFGFEQVTQGEED